MSTALAPATDDAPSAARHAADVGAAVPELVDPADRGSLSVDDRVVERVAGFAVTLVEEASAAPRRVLGVSVGEVDSNTEASVKARVDGRTATIDATVAIGWPASVRTVSARLRQRVREDVESMTGVRVDHVDIDVVSMSVPTVRRRRVL